MRSGVSHGAWRVAPQYVDTDAVWSVAGTISSWNTSGIGGVSFAALSASAAARFPPLDEQEADKHFEASGVESLPRASTDSNSCIVNPKLCFSVPEDPSQDCEDVIERCGIRVLGR
jgi:hypothetical protein